MRIPTTIKGLRMYPGCRSTGRCKLCIYSGLQIRGNVVCSIINEMDTENLERSFATLMTMATKPDYEQDGDGDIEI
ncbi:Os08g0405275 [Oryza sativa Japonica Group]|uniref:Os08g0405275 protein n=1 Tax=Oryza sativa subsp. japonica TaxID=39947 RepID=A0A0P0XFP2_ORYSJ|nr:Os08g0405275 [Oryza sativa Japonica Group]